MYIATASTTVKFNEFPQGNLIHNYQPGTKIDGPIRSISWSNDGNWLALVPHSGLTEIVSVKDQLKLVRTVHEIGEPSCVAFYTTSKKCMALGTKNGQVLIYDIKTKSTKKRFPRAASMISHVNFTAKDSHCVAACSNGDILLYSNTSNNLVYTFKIPKSNNVTALKTHVQKRNLILGGSNEGTVVVWDANVGKSKFFAEAHSAPVTSVAFSPINTMLVLTSGMDRQICIYDIDSKDRVATIPVENSCTALDFTEDASHFALASQNGKVYIYDSRQVTEPIHSFEAHKCSIKHLAFQLHRDDVESSVFVNSEEVQPKKSEIKPEDKARQRRTSELFAFAVHGSSMTDAPEKSLVPEIEEHCSVDGGDSFLAALGMSNNQNTFETSKPQVDNCSGRVEDNEFAEMKSRQSISCTPNPIKSLHEKIGLHDSKSRRVTSTPLMQTQTNLQNALSPIINVSQGQTGTNFISTDVQSTIREAVKSEFKNFDFKEEVKSTLDDIKSTLLFQSKHSIHETRRMILGMQMSMVREFMKLEDTVREELSTTMLGNDENYLVEENINLRTRILFLEQQNLKLRNELAVLRENSENVLNGN